MKYQVKLCEQKFNQSVNTSDCQWSEARVPKASSRSAENAPFTIYSWTMRIMCYVKVLKIYTIICSLVFRRWFLSRCAMLVDKHYSSFISTMCGPNKVVTFDGGDWEGGRGVVIPLTGKMANVFGRKSCHASPRKCLSSPRKCLSSPWLIAATPCHHALSCRRFWGSMGQRLRASWK